MTATLARRRIETNRGTWRSAPNIAAASEREPEVRLSMAAAIERRSQMLASIWGVKLYVHDALVVYAGEGFGPTPDKIGFALTSSNWPREMDRTRLARLHSGWASNLP